jgi:hypothetical protein
LTATSISEWITKELHSFKPSKAITIRALHHLSKKKRGNLFSKTPIPKQIAFGQLYEAVIYEHLLELTKINPNCIVVKKGCDICAKNRALSKLGQNGLFYDYAGSIVARGNGQDLAEFDFLVTNKQNEIVFGEVKTSSNNLEEFDQVIAYKRRILGFLFSKPIQFALISCVNMSNKRVIKRITGKPLTSLTVTAKLDEHRKNITPEDIFNLNKRPHNRHQSVLLSTLKPRKFNYLHLHNQCREELITAVIHNRPPTFKADAWLIKRIIVGYLNKSSMKSLFEKQSIIINKERMALENPNVFPRVVLALRMPMLRPEIYLRLQNTETYLKMGPTTTSTFEFERNIRRQRTAFFDWLENAKPGIGLGLLNKIMTKHLNDDIVGSRKKPGESPDIS